MYYPKNQSPSLSPELFRSPTSEYRGAPFWAWNDQLKPAELCRQIDAFREMGFGGFVMHPRSGLETPYLSDEFMDCVRVCNEKVKENGMFSWLYDEDRFPSGFGGGLVTCEKRFRLRQLRFTTDPLMASLPTEDPGNGEDFLVGIYDILLNSDGTLQSYAPADLSQPAKGTVWYAVCYTERPSGWYNGQAYVDTMNPEAIRKLLEVTYDAYFRAVGAEFGTSVPSVFTDEPRTYRMIPRALSHSTEDSAVAWTPDFPDTFRKSYGFDLIPCLPELVWQLPEGQPSRARYCYHDHRAARLVEAYLIPISSWCRDHGIALSGHMLGENTLVVKVPFGPRESLENLFLLGDFDVRLRGISTVLAASSRHIGFGDIVHQGMPFYGGKLSYTLPFEIKTSARAVLCVQNYRGAVVTVSLDGKAVGRILGAPYRLELGTVFPGAHQLTVTVCLSRNNSFASLHNVSGDVYKGGRYWFANGDGFAYEYQLVPGGLLQSPRLELFES